MNNKEIKEILQLIGSCCYYGKISEVECEKYCDYITNLQEKNEKLDYNLTEYTQNYLELQQRIDKALDKISKLKPFIPNEIPTWLDELENILEGKDEWNNNKIINWDS